MRPETGKGMKVKQTCDTNLTWHRLSSAAVQWTHTFLRRLYRRRILVSSANILGLKDKSHTTPGNMNDEAMFGRLKCCRVSRCFADLVCIIPPLGYCQPNCIFQEQVQPFIKRNSLVVILFPDEVIPTFMPASRGQG